MDNTKISNNLWNKFEKNEEKINFVSKAFNVIKQNKKLVIYFFVYYLLEILLTTIPGIIQRIKNFPFSFPKIISFKNIFPDPFIPKLFYIEFFLDAILIIFTLLIIYHTSKIEDHKKSTLSETIKAFSKNIYAIILLFISTEAIILLARGISILLPKDLADFRYLVSYIILIIATIPFFIFADQSVMIDNLGFLASIKRSIGFFNKLYTKVIKIFFVTTGVAFLLGSGLDVVKSLTNTFATKFFGQNIYLIFTGAITSTVLYITIASLYVTALIVALTLLYIDFKKKNKIA